MKKYLFILLIATAFTACAGKKKTTEFTGTYTNDTTTFIFKGKSVCDVVTASATMSNCDFSWDVDMQNICVVDAHQNIYILEVKGDTLKATTGSIYKKIKD